MFRFNFKMEENHPEGQTTLLQVSIEDAFAPIHSAFPLKQKTVRRSKKDTVRQKKKLKNLDIQETKLNFIDHDLQSHKNKSDEDNSVTSIQSRTLIPKTVGYQIQHPKESLLSRLINRPPYISVSPSNKISGDFGHSSAIFKRPLIEGVFYLEMLIKQGTQKHKKIAYRPSVRVGICHHAYNPAFPLGNDESIGYKSSDGTFVRNGELVAQGQPYAAGDIIGILMKISPPHKYPKPNEINEDSAVSFFKNGRLIYEFKDLKQVFYCFAVSFFNYSQVQILQGQISKYPIPCEAKHYYSVLNQTILYKDLENSKIFKV